MKRSSVGRHSEKQWPVVALLSTVSPALMKWILRSRCGRSGFGRRSQHISPADEVRDHIAPLEVVLASGSNAILPGFCGDKICPSQFVNVFGNFKKNGILIRSSDSIRVQVPFRHQSIRRETLVQSAARIAVDVFLVASDNDAELVQIEMCVESLQRIECPLDLIDSRRKRLFSLTKLKSESDTSALILPGHSSHVRPPKQFFLACPAEVGHGKSDQPS